MAPEFWDYTKFEMAFWHPFGAHGRETPMEIIGRKRIEIEINGWTLWSFRDRSPTLNHWYRELASPKRNAVFVFCSEGRGAVDPAREGTRNKTVDCQSYRFVGDESARWYSMPKGVRVLHPFAPGSTSASAFIVQRIMYPVDSFQLPVVEWFSMNNGPWRQEQIPTRGEYLIRPGGTVPMRRASAVLELKAPYLAFIESRKTGAGSNF